MRFSPWNSFKWSCFTSPVYSISGLSRLHAFPPASYNLPLTKLSFVLLCHGAGPFKRWNSNRLTVCLLETLTVDSLRRETTIRWVPLWPGHALPMVFTVISQGRCSCPHFTKEKTDPEKLSTQSKCRTLWKQIPSFFSLSHAKGKV